MADPDMDKADIFREAMKTFVRVQAGKRLAELGGTSPDMQDVSRLRPGSKVDLGRSQPENPLEIDARPSIPRRLFAGDDSERSESAKRVARAGKEHPLGTARQRAKGSADSGQRNRRIRRVREEDEVIAGAGWTVHVEKRPAPKPAALGGVGGAQPLLQRFPVEQQAAFEQGLKPGNGFLEDFVVMMSGWQDIFPAVSWKVLGKPPGGGRPGPESGHSAQNWAQY